ncbi:hypothetical protein BKA93DRAFT_762588 [Sparassis latifolia]
MILLYAVDPMDTPSGNMIWPPATLISKFAVEDLKNVCGGWRAICLTMPALCNTIYDNRYSRLEPSVVEAVVKHRTLPLNVCVNRDYPSPAIMKLFQTCGSRVRNLHVYSSRDLSLQLPLRCLEYCTNFQAPALEHLTINGDAFDGGFLTPTLFQGQVLHLKTLSLWNSAWLPANRFNSLTHLFISTSIRQSTRVPSDRNIRWAMRDLLSFISGCPNLEDLLLWNILLGCPPAIDTSAVTLRRLKRFAIGRPSPEHATWLLRHIMCPADSVAIRILNMSCKTNQLRALLPTLPLLDARIAQIQKTFNRLSVSFANGSSAVSIEIDCWPKWNATSWPTLWASWPRLAGVRELYLVGMEVVLTEHFAGIPSLLRQLSALVTLVYCDIGPPDKLLKYLSQTLHGMPCPRLETLHIYRPEDMPVNIVELVEFMEARACAGYKLRRLILEFSAEVPDGLRASVGRLGDLVEIVEVRENGGVGPRAPWPAVCSETMHKSFWPAW